jgi:hypothetical protein
MTISINDTHHIKLSIKDTQHTKLSKINVIVLSAMMLCVPLLRVVILGVVYTDFRQYCLYKSCLSLMLIVTIMSINAD